MTDPVPADGGSSDLDGRYGIGPLVGSTGAVELYTGTDSRLDRDVTIKLLRKDLADDPDRRAEFESAATTIAAAAHPNMLTIFDVGNLQGRPCVVSEQVAATFADEVGRGPVDEERVAQVALDCLAALEVAHTAGLVHGSIDAEAIAIGDDLSAKLGGFTWATSSSGAEDERVDLSPAADLRQLASTLTGALSLSSSPAATSAAGIIIRAASDVEDGRFTKASDFSSAIRGATDSTAVIPIGDDHTLEQRADEPITTVSVATRVGERWRSIGSSSRRPAVLAFIAVMIALLLVLVSFSDDDPPVPGAPAPARSGDDRLPPEVPQGETGR